MPDSSATPSDTGRCHPDAFAELARYPLLDALRDRRSRRFGAGMAMAGGPLAHTSQAPPRPLCEEEEAVLAFAACGITGNALGELEYQAGGGGTIMAGMAGRTSPSGDAIHSVSVFVTNDRATYFLKRPRDFRAEELPELVGLARGGDFLELYRRMRVEVKAGRAAPPLAFPYNLAVNRWSLYDPASTYFLPVADLTLIYLNGMLEIFGEENGAFVVDERSGLRPAGVGRFKKSRGGHLEDDPSALRTFTIQQLETLVTEFVCVEMGMVLQNLALAAQALGLGGFPHWAAHPWGWLEALGFRTRAMRGSRYLGLGPVLRFAARLLGRDPAVTLGLGIDRANGDPLLAPFCPPYYPSMEAAVAAVVALKYGEDGVFRGGARHSGWRDPDAVAEAVRPPSARAVAATVAYAEYVYGKYGRFPAYPPPLRTVLGFQTGHLDPEFYARHYRPGALSPTQERHDTVWHGAG